MLQNISDEDYRLFKLVKGVAWKQVAKKKTAPWRRRWECGGKSIAYLALPLTEAILALRRCANSGFALCRIYMALPT